MPKAWKRGPPSTSPMCDHFSEALVDFTMQNWGEIGQKLKRLISLFDQMQGKGVLTNWCCYDGELTSWGDRRRHPMRRENGRIPTRPDSRETDHLEQFQKQTTGAARISNGRTTSKRRGHHAFGKWRCPQNTVEQRRRKTKEERLTPTIRPR